jgi:hypothetical protein
MLGVAMSMPACIQKEAYAELLSTCEKLDKLDRPPWLIKVTGRISGLHQSNHNDAVEAVLLLLPRLKAEEAKSIFGSLLGLVKCFSDPLKARCMDAGILLLTRVDESAREAVLGELFSGLHKLPAKLIGKYDRCLVTWHLSRISSHQQ